MTTSSRISLTPVLFIGILSILSLGAHAEEPVVKGRLCFMTGKGGVDVRRCREVSGSRLEVEPAAEVRRYAWLSSDGKQIVVAGLEPQATVIDLEGVTGSIRLKLDGNVQRGWPADTEMTVQEKGGEWRLALTGVLASQLREIRIPRGTYGLVVNAQHHQLRNLESTTVDTKPLDLGVVALQASPRFLATVKGEDGALLAGATLVDDFGKLLAKADPLGQLSCEATFEERYLLPSRVVIDYPGRAGTRVMITDSKRDFDAGTVTLGIGGILELTVTRPDDEEFPVKVRLLEAPDNQGQAQTPRLITERVIPADSDQLRLELLPAGKSALYFKGDEPSQVLSQYVFIEAGKVTSEKVVIRPTELSIRVSKGDAAVSGANVSIGVPHGSPDYDVALPATDVDGRVSTTIWQGGTMVATASTGEITETVFFQTGEARRQEVEIRISSTVLRGRVYDGDTGEPLRKTNVGHNWKGSNSQRFGSVRTDEDGRYELKGARAGVHTLQLQLPNYLPAEAKVEMTGGENERVLDLVLTRGLEHKVRLQWNDGSPVRGAKVVQVIESGRRYRNWTSDSSGELMVNLEKEDAIELWIVPVEGSFAVAAVSGASVSTVRIPAATGALVVKSVDDSGEPMPSSHLAVRYQGKRMDYMVLSTIASLRGSSFRTGSDGTTILRGFPAGAYELWATQYDGDDFSMGEPRRQPVASFYHSGGEQEVKVVANRFGQRN